MSVIYNSLREFKNRVKDTQEYLRLIAGWLSSKFGGIDGGLVLGKEYPFEISKYSEGVFGEVFQVTPPDGHFMTTFFDVSPLSPDGKKLCVTRLPFIDRIPLPGDIAQICVIDLERQSIRCLYQTSGWGSQLGANVQWLDDENLIFNIDESGIAKSAVVSVLSGEVRKLDGPVYGLSPCKKYSYSGNLNFINALLPGYGIPDPIFGAKRKKRNSSVSDGVYRTNIETGKCELFVPMEDLLDGLPSDSPFRMGVPYVFNTKVSSCGRYLFTVLFAKHVPYRIDRAVQLFVIDLVDKNVSVVVEDEVWRKGGHHPNWVAGANEIVMNLKMDAKFMQFVIVDAVTAKIRVIAPGIKGGGHPSLSPDARYLLTDAYVTEGYTSDDGTVPIRLIDLHSNKEFELTRVFTNKLQGPRRVDPHPVWADGGRKVFINAVIDGKRQVLMANFRGGDNAA